MITFERYAFKGVFMDPSEGESDSGFRLDIDRQVNSYPALLAHMKLYL